MTAYVTREDWGARPAVSVTPMARPVSTLYVHHSVTPISADPKQMVRTIQRQHQNVNGWSDIAYQELVAENGDVFEGRGFDRQGGATRGHNSTSLAVCFLGNFEQVDPSEASLDSLVARCVQAVRDGRLTESFELRGHRDANPTACPGARLYARLPVVRRRVAAALAGTVEEEALTPEQMQELKDYIDAKVATLDQRILTHVNGVNDGVKAEVERLAEAGRRHSKTMTDSIKADIERLER